MEIEGLNQSIHLDDDEQSYSQAQRILNCADFGYLRLEEEDRKKLNDFIRDYQTSRVRL